jgi:GNAT superfamily N-acetyltransferase
MPFEAHRDDYLISSDKARLDVAMIHQFLSQESYWAKGISRVRLERSIRNSLTFGVYRKDEQVGFAKVVTDYATFAYVGDVFVLPTYRGRGLSRWLLEVIVAHPELQGLRRWLLASRDAQSLYRKVGFQPLTDTGRWLQLWDPNSYKNHED